MVNLCSAKLYIEYATFLSIIFTTYERVILILYPIYTQFKHQFFQHLTRCITIHILHLNLSLHNAHLLFEIARQHLKMLTNKPNHRRMLPICLILRGAHGNNNANIS
eukprot:235982_1